MTAVAQGPVAAVGRPQPRRRPARRRGVVRSVPLLPALVLLAVFMLGPIVTALVNSFTDSALTGPAARNPSWVGGANYAHLAATPELPASVLTTLIFVFASAIVGQNVLGMVLAVLLRSAGRVVAAIVSTIMIGAWVLPEIVAGFAAYAFFSQTGTLNAVLGLIGLGQTAWLFAFPLLCVILANIWRGTSYSMLVYSAALTDVPAELIESAEMDGANAWQRFFRVVVPQITNTILTNLMLITLQTLSVFTLIWVMTRGGPENASMTLPVLAYQDAFQFSQIGYGTAIATILLLVGGVFAVVYIRLLNRARA